MPELLCAATAKFGDEPALVDGSVRLSFSDVTAKVDAVASGLVAAGVEAGDVIVSQLPNWWESVVMAHASFRAGAIFCPLLPQMRERELAHVLRDSGARVLVTADNFRGRSTTDILDGIDVSNLTSVVVRAGRRDLRASIRFEALAAASSPLPEPVARTADDACLLLYTSGTESLAKGVIHTANTLISEARTVVAAHELSELDSLLLAAPMSHVGGFVYGNLVPLVTAAKVALLDVWDSQRAVEIMVAENVSFFSAVPFFVRSVLALDTDLSRAARGMRLVAMGGSRITAEDVRAAAAAFDCPAKRSYGSTELPTLTTGPANADPDILATTDGRPIAPAAVRILDEDGNDVAPGSIGEIVCIGPEMFQGYRDGTLNDTAFTEDGWFRSGDLGSVDARGFLTVGGRIKDVIIRGGENYSSEEVEQLLLLHPAIADVAIVAYPDDLYGERACAFVVARTILSLDDIVTFLRSRGLASFKQPERLELRAELPSTGTGKIRKAVLRREAAAITSGR